MRDVTEAVFMLVLATDWLVSVAEGKEDPRVNGRVAVLITELPTVWLVTVFTLVLVREDAVSVCGENDDPPRVD